MGGQNRQGFPALLDTFTRAHPSIDDGPINHLTIRCTLLGHRGEPHPARRPRDLVTAEQTGINESPTDMRDLARRTAQEPSHDGHRGLSHTSTTGQHPPHQPMPHPLSRRLPGDLADPRPHNPRQLLPAVGVGAGQPMPHQRLSGATIMADPRFQPTTASELSSGPLHSFTARRLRQPIPAAPLG